MTGRPPLEEGLRVGVHVNLHRARAGLADCFTVNHPPTGPVLANVTAITLDGVQFRVQPSCLRSMRQAGQRAVCAYAAGTVAAHDPDTSGLARVTFHGFDRDTFTIDDRDPAIPGAPVTRASRVTFADRAGWVSRDGLPGADRHTRLPCPACGAIADTYTEDGRLMVVSHRDPGDRFPAWCDAGSDQPAPALVGDAR